MVSAPCKDCVTREMGCHSRCPVYYIWRKKKDVVRDKKNKLADDDEFFNRKYWHRNAIGHYQRWS